MSRFAILDDVEEEVSKVTKPKVEVKENQVPANTKKEEKPKKQQATVMEPSKSKGKPRANHGYPKGNRELKADAENPLVKVNNKKAKKTNKPHRVRKAENPENEAHDAEKNPATAEVAATEGEPAAAPAEPEVPAEPVKPTFTLEEFMKKRNEERARSSLFSSVRRVVEDDFSGFTVKVNKESQDLVFSGAPKANRRDRDGQRATTKQVITDLGFKIDDNRSSRNVNTNNNNKSRARIDLNDTKAFPSLK